PHISHRST
ncbi:hypothetical protein EAI_09088, partial [Harpegnathos saltator]